MGLLKLFKRDPIQLEQEAISAPVISLLPPSPTEEKFANVASLVDMVIQGINPSVLICGDSGLGKTYLVRQQLQAAGLREFLVGEDLDQPEQSLVSFLNITPVMCDNYKPSKTIGNYTFVKGHSTAFGLYKTLLEHCDGIIVFDDCDSIFKDTKAVNILKAALDSYDQRIVTWSAARMPEDLPETFEFRGRVIFISNLPASKIDPAVRSRSLVINLSLTKEELLQHMAEILPAVEPSIPEGERQEVLAYLAGTQLELNMRTLIKAIRLRHANPQRWQQMLQALS